MDHVQVDRNTELKDVLSKKKDLFGITEFYNNYTTKNEKRNYKSCGLIRFCVVISISGVGSSKVCES